MVEQGERATAPPPAEQRDIKIMQTKLRFVIDVDAIARRAAKDYYQQVTPEGARWDQLYEAEARIWHFVAAAMVLEYERQVRMQVRAEDIPPKAGTR